MNGIIIPIPAKTFNNIFISTTPTPNASSNAYDLKTNNDLKFFFAAGLAENLAVKSGFHQIANVPSEVKIYDDQGNNNWEDYWNFVMGKGGRKGHVGLYEYLFSPKTIEEELDSKADKININSLNQDLDNYDSLRIEENIIDIFIEKKRFRS